MTAAIASVEIIGGVPPYAISTAGAPNDFSGCVDIVATDSSEVFDIVPNANAVEIFPSGGLLTGQLIVMDVLRRSRTFDPFTVQYGGAPVTPTVGQIILLHSIG